MNSIELSFYGRGKKNSLCCTWFQPLRDGANILLKVEVYHSGTNSHSSVDNPGLTYFKLTIEMPIHHDIIQIPNTIILMLLAVPMMTVAYVSSNSWLHISGYKSLGIYSCRLVATNFCWIKFPTLMWIMQQ